MRYEKILVEDSEKYFDLFDPDLYNPREWAKMAKAAGMKYAVITTKHHEGFCLFKTDYTDYQALNPPLCRKDLIREWVETFRAEGLKVGFITVCWIGTIRTLRLTGFIRRYLKVRSELRFGKANASVTHKDELDEKDILLALPDVGPDVEIPVIELISN